MKLFIKRILYAILFALSIWMAIVLFLKGGSAIVQAGSPIIFSLFFALLFLSTFNKTDDTGDF